MSANGIKVEVRKRETPDDFPMDDLRGGQMAIVTRCHPEHTDNTGWPVFRSQSDKAFFFLKTGSWCKCGERYRCRPLRPGEEVVITRDGDE